MKKIISVSFAVLLLLACLYLPASAAGQGTMTISSATGCHGDSVTLSIAITDNPGTSSFQVSVGFDSAVLQLTDVSKTSALGSTAPSPLNNPCTMSWIDTGATANTYTGVIATLTFRILDGAVPGNTNVSVSFVSSYDLNTQKNTFNSPTATVKVGHVPGAWTESEPAGCVTPGKEKTNCTLCGDEMQRDINPVGHSFGDWQSVTPADCSGPGKDERECTRCHTKEPRDVSPLGHSFGDWQNVTPASCTTSGKDERECSRCSAKEPRDVNPLGHAFSSPVVTKPASCKETGVETGTCSRCNEKAEQIIPVLPHTYGNWEKDKEATCTEAGTQKRVCGACQHKLTRKVAATGHDFEEPKLVKEATLYEEGLMEGKCKKCKETTQQVIPCAAVHEESGITVNATSGIFTDGTQLKVNVAEEGSELYDLISRSLAEKGSEFYGFSIGFDHNGVAVTPGGAFSVVIPALDFENPAVYSVSIEEEAAVLEYSVKEDGFIVVETDDASIIAVLNTDSDPLEATDPDPSDEGDPPAVSKPDDEFEVPAVTTEIPPVNGEKSSGTAIGFILIFALGLSALGACYWFFFLKN